MSKNKINNFVRNYNIDLDDFLPEEGLLTIIRTIILISFLFVDLKTEKKLYQSAGEFAAPCEARYYAYDSLDVTEVVPVKGKYFTAEAILNNSDLAKEFNQGHYAFSKALSGRLSPVFTFLILVKLLKNIQFMASFIVLTL